MVVGASESIGASSVAPVTPLSPAAVESSADFFSEGAVVVVDFESAFVAESSPQAVVPASASTKTELERTVRIFMTFGSFERLTRSR